MISVNILIVEDDDLFCSYIAQLLRNHDIFIAHKLCEAKKIISEKNLDIIFLDLNLPDGKGNDILDFIFENDPDAFVTIVTSDNKLSTIKDISKYNIAGYVLKPFTSNAIEHCLEEYEKRIIDYL